MVRIPTERWPFFVNASAEAISAWLLTCYYDAGYRAETLLPSSFWDDAYEETIHVTWAWNDSIGRAPGAGELIASFHRPDGRTHGIHVGSGAPLRIKVIPLAAERTELWVDCLAEPPPDLAAQVTRLLGALSQRWPEVQPQLAAADLARTAVRDEQAPVGESRMRPKRKGRGPSTPTPVRRQVVLQWYRRMVENSVPVEDFDYDSAGDRITMAEYCRTVGIGVTTLKRWKREFPEEMFADELEEYRQQLVRGRR